MELVNSDDFVVLEYAVLVFASDVELFSDSCVFNRLLFLVSILTLLMISLGPTLCDNKVMVRPISALLAHPEESASIAVYHDLVHLVMFKLVCTC